MTGSATDMTHTDTQTAPKKFEELTYMDHNSPRFRRSIQFAEMIRTLLRDYLPPGRDAQHFIYDHLVRTAWENNFEIINVPPEWDALDKLAIERATMEVKVTRLNGENP